MNKRITQYQIILTSCCLLLASTQAQADRPAMDERSEAFESEVIDISTDLEEVPVFEEISVFEKMPVQENRPTIQETSNTEELPDLEARPGREEAPAIEADMLQEQQADELQPSSDINNNKTETEITGDVIELQAGETLPVTVIDFPHRGMSMEKVKNELGQALSVSDAIGDPPITTWTYSDRIVYFEYTHVIHVVATH
ncbi:MAG: hypothetical protein ABUK13_05465 [Gammaproteobacteria bacterium]